MVDGYASHVPGAFDEPAPVGPAEFPFDDFRSRRFGSEIRCPRCAGSRVHRWGGFSGRRRYRCLTCTRTFSDFTKTPLAYLKKIDRWPEHCASTLEPEPLRREAARLGIHRDTAFRWRHRTLRGIDEAETQPLRGIVATRETTFHHSEKGSRRLARPARRKAVPFHRGGLSLRTVWVVVARSDAGRVLSGPASTSRPTHVHYSRILHGRLAEGSRLTSRWGAHGGPAVFARRSGIQHLDPRSCRGEFAALSAYVMRLRSWIRRFHGVATRYLGNYLAWHRFLHHGSLGDPNNSRRQNLMVFVEVPFGVSMRRDSRVDTSFLLPL